MTILTTTQSGLIGTKPTEIILSRRSFLGWTAKIGIIVATAPKLIVPEFERVASFAPYNNEHLIRAHLWNAQLKKLLLEEFNSMKEIDYG